MNLEEVITFLKQNPDFFEHNPDVAEAILSNSAGDSAPFIERQLQVLKNRENQQQKRIDLIIDSVKNNQKLEKDLMQFASSLLDEYHSAQDPGQGVVELIKRQFNISQIILVLNDDDQHPAYDELKQRVSHAGSVCDDRMSSVLREKLFAQSAEEIHSAAFVPIIKNAETSGVLVMGSRDKDRFKPDMGVSFLDNMGVLISRYLSGHGVI